MLPQHHLHSEGIEIGSLPVLTQHVIHNTKRIRSVRLVTSCPDDRCAWRLKSPGSIGSDQGAHVRGFCAWVSDPMAQFNRRVFTSSSATSSDRSETDRINHEAFEEIFHSPWRGAMSLFRFKGKYYEYPYPQEGTPWPAHAWTREFGLPGEVDEAGLIQKINANFPASPTSGRIHYCSRPFRSARKRCDGARASRLFRPS